MKNTILYLCALILLSCSSKTTEDRTISTRGTINLNFTTNILNLDSAETYTEAEKFVKTLTQGNNASYRITNIDDDILCELESLDSISIQNITLRFLKNEEAILNQFLEGKLDLISIKTYENFSPNSDFLIKQIHSDPYSNYQINRGNRAKVVALKLENISRQKEIEHLMELLDLRPDQVFLDSTRVLLDTLQLEQLSIQTTDSSLLNIEDSLIVWQHYVDGINPLKPSIHSQEIIIENMSSDIRSIARYIHEQDSSNMNTIGTIVLEIFPEYYITSNALNGLKDYKKLSDLVPKLYFDTIRSY